MDVSVQSAVRSAMDSYLAAMNAGDYALAVQSYCYPSFSLSQQGAASFATAEDLLGLLAPAFIALRERGFHRSAWREMRLIPLGPAVTLASCVFDRQRADGSVLETAAATYALHLCDGAWRIAAVVVHPPEALLPAASVKPLLRGSRSTLKLNS